MATAARDIVFAAAPLTYNRPDALRYTGLSDKLFGQLERNGQLTGRRIGRNGELIFLREQLDAVTSKLFGAVTTSIDDEFEGLGG
ncbi:MAG: hypothetical protein ACRYHC_02630 [Janthinobacterium lividum]